MLWNLYMNENTKLFRCALYWVGLTVLLAMGVGILGLFLALATIPGLSQNLPPEQVEMFKHTLTWPTSFYAVLKLSGSSMSLGGLLAFVLVGVVTAQEYPWRTVNLTVGHGTPRELLLAAKLLSILTALAGWMAMLVLAVGVFTVFTSRMLSTGPDLGSVNIAHLGLSILRVLLALSPYAAAAFFLALATRSVVAAIGVIAGFAMAVEPLIIQLAGLAGGGLSQLAGYLPMMLSSSLLQANEPGGLAPIGASGGMDPGTAAAIIAAYAGFFLLLAFRTFRRQDLSS